jgi:cytochrome c biogenesis protein CcmG, thiol:disulfide interchange protein DsbE
MSEPASAPPPGEAEERPQRDRAGPLLRAVQLVALVAVAALLVLLVWRVVHAGSGAHLVREIRSGNRPAAPQFTLPVLWAHDETWPTDARHALVDGELSLRELRGHVVVINFWASWCGPCKDEAPLFAASARANSGEVVFLGIDVQDFKSDARKFLKRFDTPYVSVRAGGGRYDVYSDYGLTGVPETYWLDARGQIVAHYPGQISRRRQLEDGIREAVRAQ